MSSQAVILVILIGVPTLLRVAGFAEPVAAIVAAAAALWIVAPPRAGLADPIDFARIIDETLIVVVVAAVIGALVAGCQSAPRPRHPLGWYAAGDAAFIGALLVAVVLGAISFATSVAAGLTAALLIGTVLWLVTTGVGALVGRARAAKEAPSALRALGIGLFALASIGFLVVPAISLGVLTPSEAFTFFGLPIALIFRLVVALILERGIAGYGIDLLRGVADAAWIVLAVLAAGIAALALRLAGGDAALPALPPVTAAIAFAAAILLLGVLVGATYGALLAAAIFAPLLTAADVPAGTSALIFLPALMLSYARPTLGLTLLAPAFGGAARRISAAEAAAIAAGVVVVFAVAAFMAASSA